MTYSVYGSMASKYQHRLVLEVSVPSHGLLACSNENPGRIVRVVLLAVVCDKPAAHKLGGFGAPSHTFMCTCCWVSLHVKGDPSAYKPEGMSM